MLAGPHWKSLSVMWAPCWKIVIIIIIIIIIIIHEWMFIQHYCIIIQDSFLSMHAAHFHKERYSKSLPVENKKSPISTRSLQCDSRWWGKNHHHTNKQQKVGCPCKSPAYPHLSALFPFSLLARLALFLCLVCVCVTCWHYLASSSVSYNFPTEPATQMSNSTQLTSVFGVSEMFTTRRCANEHKPQLWALLGHLQ